MRTPPSMIFARSRASRLSSPVSTSPRSGSAPALASPGSGCGFLIDRRPRDVRCHFLPLLLLNGLQKPQRTIEAQQRTIEKRNKTIAGLDARLARLEILQFSAVVAP